MSLGVGEVDWRLSDQEIHAMLISIEEWRDAHDHLKDQDSEGPPIHGEVVTIANQHLGGEILCRTTE